MMSDVQFPGAPVKADLQTHASRISVLEQRIDILEALLNRVCTVMRDTVGQEVYPPEQAPPPNTIGGWRG